MIVFYHFCGRSISSNRKVLALISTLNNCQNLKYNNIFVMSWSAKSVNNMPKVLAGPILRRITRKSVSVFIATKDGASATLKVFAPNGSTPILTATSTPKKLGEHLYVQVITASSETNVLDRGIVYGYNIYWGRLHPRLNILHW